MTQADHGFFSLFAAVTPWKDFYATRRLVSVLLVFYYGSYANFNSSRYVLLSDLQSIRVRQIIVIRCGEMSLNYFYNDPQLVALSVGEACTSRICISSRDPRWRLLCNFLHLSWFVVGVKQSNNFWCLINMICCDACFEETSEDKWFLFNFHIFSSLSFEHC